MRLSQIKLAGFKSFVDPTHIHAPGQIVGIVGPNGCGKSNIIDALRWVLGESRASALRGKSMQDVIFNGSGNRKPVARASVELVFDNSQGRVAGQWSNYAEIAVKRVLQRDAESSYFINNLRVRRKDVSDIFLGTGLGGQAYAIIEQGMISRIIEADPEDLKVFLEEAAGISKYRERRRETELRLSATRGNLQRVEDITRELRERIEHLEDQARVAKIYHELQASLKRTQNLLWLRRKMKARELRRKLVEEASGLETAMEAETANLRHLENQLVRARDEHDSTSQKLQDAQGAMYQANAEVSRLQQQIDHLKSNRLRAEARIESGKKELDMLELQYAEALDNRRQWQQDAAEARRQCETCQLEVEKLKTACSDTHERMKEAERLFEEARLALSAGEHQEKIEQAHWGHCENTLNQLAKKREKFAEAKRLLPQMDEARLAMLEADLAGMEARMALEAGASSEIAQRLDTARAARQDAFLQLQENESNIAEIRARLAALREIQEGLEKRSDLGAWLAENRLDRLPRLWSKIGISAGWENALESVLRERVHAILTEPCQGENPPGEMVFVQNGAFSPESSGNPSLVPLLSLITLSDQAVGGALCDWLSSAFIAPDMEQAMTLRPMLGASELLVTPEGHIVTRHSVHYYGADSRVHGVLIRQQEIERLLASENDAALLLEASRKLHEDREEEAAGLESALKEKSALFSRLEQEKHELQLQRIRVSEANGRIREQSVRIIAEMDEIESQFRAELEKKLEIGKKIEVLREEITLFRERQNIARQELDQMRRLFDEKNRLMQHAVGKNREAEFHEKSCSVKLDELERRIELLSRNMAQGKAALNALGEEVSAQDPASLDVLLQQALVTRQENEEALLAVRKASEELSSRLRELDGLRQGSELKLGPLREKIGDIRLKEQEARISEEQFDASLKAAGAVEEELAGMLEKAPDSARLQAEISKLNGRIESLGAVNLAAFEELQAAQERKGYIDSQVQDLSEAAETLESAIRRIDRETRERLMATFDEVNRNFGELFQQLFGGGRARLVLTGDQIIDSGMEIEAQPPGKKNASIRLLSGGEKALTAISLVFSLFKLNPAPFCLLDEVDAPLDDSNTGRFCDMVRKMAEHTQFLFISHNKTTMEMAHQLIGVTMQEQGVSRIVAVDVEAASRKVAV